MNLSPLNIAIIQEQLAKLRELCGEEDYQLLSDMIEGETDFDKILGKVSQQIVETEMAAVSKKELAKVYANSAKSKEATAGALRETALRLLDASGLKKHITPHATLSLIAGRASIKVDEAAIYDEEFYDKTLNTSRVRAAVKEGRKIEGATQVMGNQSIMVRV